MAQYHIHLSVIELFMVLLHLRKELMGMFTFSILRLLIYKYHSLKWLDFVCVYVLVKSYNVSFEFRISLYGQIVYRPDGHDTGHYSMCNYS